MCLLLLESQDLRICGVVGVAACRMEGDQRSAAFFSRSAHFSFPFIHDKTVDEWSTQIRGGLTGPPAWVIAGSRGMSGPPASTPGGFHRSKRISNSDTEYEDPSQRHNRPRFMNPYLRRNTLQIATNLSLHPSTSPLYETPINEAPVSKLTLTFSSIAPPDRGKAIGGRICEAESEIWRYVSPKGLSMYMNSRPSACRVPGSARLTPFVKEGDFFSGSVRSCIGIFLRE